MAATFQLPSLQSPLLQKSQFLGQAKLFNSPQKSAVITSFKLPSSSTSLNATAKFNLYEILGGRGLLNGEEGIEKELKKPVTQEEISPPETTSNGENQEESSVPDVPKDGFEKELLGLTGGFPGGEKGLQKFIEQNPPPPPQPKKSKAEATATVRLVKKAMPPDLPLLLPGMIAIVKNPNSPFYMYCGIVQRVTDGKAGVLFEGGNWDRLITFRLEELERREKGPPMVNPKSVILEEMLEKSSK